MPYSLEEKLLFVHIPKCGGTSFNSYLCAQVKDYERFLPGFDHDHNSLREALAWLDSAVDKFRLEEWSIVVLLRDPFTRLWSLYEDWKRNVDPIIKDIEDFEGFVHQLAQAQIAHPEVDQRFLSAINSELYLQAPPFPSNVQFYAMYELDAVLAELARKFDWETNLDPPRENANPNNTLEQCKQYLAVRPELVKEIESLCSKELLFLAQHCPAALSRFNR